MKRLFEVNAWPSKYKAVVVADDQHDAISKVTKALVGTIAELNSSWPIEAIEAHNIVTDIVASGLTAKEVRDN